jgi:hypothetical protein
MKYIELTGYGNETKHLVALALITNIEFLKEYTKIYLSGSSVINVNENYSVIEELISINGGEITTQSHVNRNKLQNTMWSEYNNTLHSVYENNK